MKTILIVDDEKRIRSLYTQLFSKEGFRVIATSKATDANEILLREKVDIMLLDINMPGVDGSELHEVMNLFHKKVKVIVCSVYPLEDQKEIVEGAAGYYDKSQGLRELLKKVKAVLDKEPQAKEPGGADSPIMEG
ncbi:MAG: response regulator [Nitrospirae bacterium]|nr:response regulator [Nitrospirota bacterium]